MSGLGNTIGFSAASITKTFPGVVALENANMTMFKGSIHALLGENGAGKSTLIKAITGVHRPDSGLMSLNGTPFAPQNTHDAMASGVGVVHQERNLIPRFSIAENIFLEKLSRSPLRPINYKQLFDDARHWLELLEIDAEPSLPVSQLSVAKTQLVEIAKALSINSNVLLLDEPTASLTSHETDTLFSILRRLRDKGTSLMFVSHKLEEVQEICDHVTVLRDGRNACDSQPLEGLNRQEIVRLMIGRSEQIPNWAARDRSTEKTMLELKNVSTAVGHKNVSLSVHRGEIAGLYGLVGAGRSELAKAILGKFSVIDGNILVNKKLVKIASIADAVRHFKIGYVSENRKSEGLILMHSVLENVGLPVWRRLAHIFAPLTNKIIRQHTAPFIQKLEVRTPSLDQRMDNLSGGNQQKVSVAKWLAANVQILIVDEPSVGIDIKTKAYLHELIRELSNQGTAILLITSDMPEMITLADRIIVMKDFRVMGGIHNTRDYDTMSEGIMALIHGD